MRKKTIVLSLFSIATTTIAQTSQINFDKFKEFKEAKHLYLTETYNASQNKFDKFLDKNATNNSEAAEFYSSIIGLINNERNAEDRFLSFEKKYPKSVYTQTAYWELGSFYLQSGNYRKAYTYFKKGNLHDLPDSKRNEFQFKLGYAAFMNNNDREALRLLEPLSHSDKFGDDASYYVGHIHYANKDFDKAFTYFNELKRKNPLYENKVLPYVVQIEFNQQEYEKAIADGKKLLSVNHDRFISSEVSKIIGESYFRLKEYNQAIPYLEAYTGEKSNADYYQLGYAYYQKGDFSTAISLLNKIIEEENPLSQTAYFQLGNAYLQSDQKQEALTAFKSASEMSFNQKIQEDAFYNYAKLSYEIGNPFVGVPEVLRTFTKDYPKSKYTKEINNYLVDAYISSGNYKNALEVLSSFKTKDQTLLNAQQKAAFLYGTNLVKDGNMTTAHDNFVIATNIGNDEIIKARAHFWLGETAYSQGNYQEALDNFKKFESIKQVVPESNEINYQLGYTYLKLRQYSKAIAHFESYLASKPAGDFQADAKLRLADSYIGNQQTEMAFAIYNELATQENSVSDEAAYNSAVALGILGKTDEKINLLKGFLSKYPTSQYYEIAMYELALAYTQKNNTNEALNYLDKLIKNSGIEMTSRARLQKAVIYNNKNQLDKSLNEYKYVAENYPNTQLALDAIEGAKRIYLEENKLSAFEKWAKTLNYYSIDLSELELLAYTSANDLYDQKKYNEAIDSFLAFNQKYPTSAYSAAVNYKLGESYYQTQKYNEAEQPLSNVALSNNEYQEDALLRLAQLYLKQNKDTKALLVLENLNNITTNESYRTYTEIHLMRFYSQNNNHKNAVLMANKVLENNKNEQSVKQEAELIKARNLFASNRLEEAKVAFKSLEKASANVVKAEALYYKAYFLNKEKNYKESNKIVFELATNYSEHQLWGSKSLIIMADNYYHLGDLYQANTTIDAVIANYQDFPDVVAEAKKLKSKIVSK